jgi:hypothetical protein
MISIARTGKRMTDLDSDDLNRLVPGSQSTTNGTGKDLVESTKLLSLLDTPDISQRALGKSSETHSRSPIGSLTNSNGIDTLVDTGQTFTLVNIGKDLEGRLDGGADTSLLVSGDLDSLHTSAET